MDVKAKTLALVGEVDAVELAVVCLEAAGRLKRPCASAHEAFRTIDREDQEAWMRVALAATKYIAESISAAQRPV